MAARLHHITPLLTLAAALSIWSSPVAAADPDLGRSCAEITDTGECLSPQHGNTAPSAVEYSPRQPYLDSVRQG
jgi:hypothetical protein